VGCVLRKLLRLLKTPPSLVRTRANLFVLTTIIRGQTFISFGIVTVIRLSSGTIAQDRRRLTNLPSVRASGWAVVLASCSTIQSCEG